MSTRAFASTVIALPIEQVWTEIRQFTFPGKFIANINNVTIEQGGNPTQIGSVRKITWKNGETRRQRLVALSDMDYTVTWERMPGEGDGVWSNVDGCMTTIHLHRITDSKWTLMSWGSVFSADVKGKTIVEEEEDYKKNLAEIRDRLTGGQE